MAQMPQLRTIANGQDVDATDPDYNFDTIESHLASEVINRDGTVAMTGPLTLSPGTLPSHAASLSDVEAAVPVGTIVMHAGNNSTHVPDGWLLCDGSTIQKSTYPVLAGFLETRYGGTTNSPKLPNLQSFFPVGAGGAFAGSRGDTGGSKDAVVVSHDHNDTFAVAANGGHSHGDGSYQVNIDHNHGSVTTSTNSRGHTHTVNPASVFATLRNYAGSYIQSTKIFRDRRYIGSTNVSTEGTDYITSETYTGDQGASGDPESVRKFDVKVDVASTTTGGESQNHTHTVDLPALGTTNKSVTGTSASVADHGHTLNGKVSSEGVSGTGKNLPPYIALNFIIRADY